MELLQYTERQASNPAAKASANAELHRISETGSTDLPRLRRAGSCFSLRYAAWRSAAAAWRSSVSFAIFSARASASNRRITLGFSSSASSAEGEKGAESSSVSERRCSAFTRRVSSVFSTELATRSLYSFDFSFFALTAAVALRAASASRSLRSVAAFSLASRAAASDCATASETEELRSFALSTMAALCAAAAASASRSRTEFFSAELRTAWVAFRRFPAASETLTSPSTRARAVTLASSAKRFASATASFCSISALVRWAALTGVRFGIFPEPLETRCSITVSPPLWAPSPPLPRPASREPAFFALLLVEMGAASIVQCDRPFFGQLACRRAPPH
mmetsp:Transcript_19337/g.49152  ORF Transcript_19337/g.49152 Transcript_19337/m.49152 type:complete len:337 (-) Transcript_19337:11-1021(-)